MVPAVGHKVVATTGETYRKSVEEGDVMIRIGGGYDKELKMEVRAIDDKPLTVLAMVYGLEVG